MFQVKLALWLILVHVAWLGNDWQEFGVRVVSLNSEAPWT